MVAFCRGVYNGLMTQIGTEMQLHKPDSKEPRAATLSEAGWEVVRIGTKLGTDLIHLNFANLKNHAIEEARGRPTLLTTVTVAALAVLIAEPILFGIGATVAALSVKLIAFTFSAIISTVSFVLSCGVTLVSFVLHFLQTCFWWGVLLAGLSTAIPLIASHNKAEMKQGFDFFRGAWNKNLFLEQPKPKKV